MTDGRAGTSAADGGLIRNEPVQARSAARLTALLDAAAEAVADVGFERLTTAMVAERAGASIGTVYRYFPDRITVLQALSVRNLERLTGAVTEEMARGEHDSVDEALEGAITAMETLFRTEPGFRTLRLGDMLGLRAPAVPSPKALLAARMAEQLDERFGIGDREEFAAELDVALEVVDALLARAFLAEPDGDARFLSEARRALDLLVSREEASQAA